MLCVFCCLGYNYVSTTSTMCASIDPEREPTPKKIYHKVRRNKKWVKVEKPIKKIIKGNLVDLGSHLNEDKPRWLKDVRGPNEEEKKKGVDVVLTIYAHPMGKEPDAVKPFKIRLVFAEDSKDAIRKKVHFMRVRQQEKASSNKNTGPWAWPIVLRPEEKGKDLVFHLDKLMVDVESDRNVILIR